MHSSLHLLYDKMDSIKDGWGNNEYDPVEDGWGDDELDILDDDEDDDVELASLNQEQVQQDVPNSSKLAVDEGSGWDWNEDVDFDDDNDTNNGIGPHLEPIQNAAAPIDPFVKIAEQKLISYIGDLSNPALLNRLNDQLATERNNSDSALQLCHYYHERENLRAYTLDSEVPRMDYQIMICDELILTKADEIQEHFRQNPVDNLVDDMLLRSSNQSLLADIFPIITGPDKIVRMQFHANAVATKCRLVLDMRAARSSQVDCTMTISIPSGRSPPNTKLNLAEVRFMIQFSPEPSGPYVNYQLLSLKPLIDVHADEAIIRSAAEALDPHHMEAMEEETLPRISDNLRDNFLDSVIFTGTATGFKSALKEIDGIVNVSKKFSMLKQHLALPSGDDILHAEQHSYERDADRSTTIMKHESDIPRKNPAPTGHASHPPPPAARRDPSAPKPIIGGLLMSGISRLAKAASIPEENDTPLLYRRQDIPPPINPNQNHSQMRNAPLVPPLPNRANPVTGKDAEIIKQYAPTSFGKNAKVTDNINDDEDDNFSDGGWSDDGLDDLDDRSGATDYTATSSAVVEAHNPPMPPAPIDFQPKVEAVTPKPSQGHQSSYAPLPFPMHDATQAAETDGEDLTPELRAERECLLRKLDEIARVQSHLQNIDLDSNEGGEQISRRTRFVSRAKILNY